MFLIATCGIGIGVKDLVKHFLLAINKNDHMDQQDTLILQNFQEVLQADCLLPFCLFLFCSEENVWKLCDYVRKQRTAPLEHLFVIFISNETRTVRTKCQYNVRFKMKMMDFVIVSSDLLLYVN